MHAAEFEDDVEARREDATALALQLKSVLDGHDARIVVSALAELVAHGIAGSPLDRQDQFLREVQFIIAKRVRELRRSLGKLA